MTADHTHLLDADNLRISRGMAVVLEKISLAISAGQAMVITGPNGSGKTTLLRGLTGLLPLDHGEVRLMGVSSRDDRQHLQDHLIYIGHKDGLSGALTTLENMQLWAQCHNLAISDAEMEKAFDDLGVAPLMHSEARRLSEGQRRRCGLVRLAISQRSFANGGHRKSLWCLDEPLTAIDQAAASRLCAMINRHTETGGGAIISTHSPLQLDHMTTLALTHHSISEAS